MNSYGSLFGFRNLQKFINDFLTRCRSISKYQVFMPNPFFCESLWIICFIIEPDNNFYSQFFKNWYIICWRKHSILKFIIIKLILHICPKDYHMVSWRLSFYLELSNWDRHFILFHNVHILFDWTFYNKANQVLFHILFPLNSLITLIKQNNLLCICMNNFYYN